MADDCVNEEDIGKEVRVWFTWLPDIAIGNTQFIGSYEGTGYSLGVVKVQAPNHIVNPTLVLSDPELLAKEQLRAVAISPDDPTPKTLDPLRILDFSDDHLVVDISTEIFPLGQVSFSKSDDSIAGISSPFQLSTLVPGVVISSVMQEILR